MDTTTTTHLGGTWPLGDLPVTRLGYGAMQLAGPGVMGPPTDRDAALAVLHEAFDLGITHVDTSAAYGPHVTNELIRTALRGRSEAVVVSTKVGGDRDAGGGWPPARRPADLRRQVEENLRTLGVERLDLVNLRMGDATGPGAGSLAEPLGTLVELQREGLIRHLGLSNVTAEQVTEAQGITSIVSVQNMYNLAFRHDDALIDRLAADGISYVPFFPLGGFSPLQSQELSAVAERLGASPMSVAVAWLLQRSPNILVIPGTSSVDHLRENASGADLRLGEEDVVRLDRIGS